MHKKHNTTHNLTAENPTHHLTHDCHPICPGSTLAQEWSHESTQNPTTTTFIAAEKQNSYRKQEQPSTEKWESGKGTRSSTSSFPLPTPQSPSPPLPSYSTTKLTAACTGYIDTCTIGPDEAVGENIPVIHS